MRAYSRTTFKKTAKHAQAWNEAIYNVLHASIMSALPAGCIHRIPGTSAESILAA